MKKLISSIIFTMLFVSCLSLTVFAETTATISNDYQTLSLDGKSYSRINTSMLEIDSYDEMDVKFELTSDQKETIKEISLESNENQTILFAEITFSDNATLSVDFLQDTYIKEYRRIMAGDAEQYVIDFEWPEGNTVNAAGADLFGPKYVLDNTQLDWCDYFFVAAQSQDGTLSAIIGAILSVDDGFYYINFADIYIEYIYDFIPSDYHELSVHKITNESLLADLTSAEDAYYADDFGFLSDDDLSRSVSIFFLVFLFGIIPFIIFVVFLVLSFHTGPTYKKCFRVIYILSLAELVVFVISAIILILSGP